MKAKGVQCSLDHNVLQNIFCVLQKTQKQNFDMRVNNDMPFIWGEVPV